MRMSQLFSQTLREAPADAQSEGFALLVRAGFIRQIAAGIFATLPLGLRALRKIEAIMREEMNAIGGQELSMPVVLPADLWKETGRWYTVGAELARLGLINYAVPAAELDAKVDDIVQRLLQKSAYALARTKRLLNRRVVDQLNLTLDASVGYEMVNWLQPFDIRKLG